MADQADVERALVGLIAGILFPTITYLPGDVQPSAAIAVPPGPSTVAGPVYARVYRGWPQNTLLLQDLNSGIANVSVYSEPGMVRNTTRYTPRPHLVAYGVPTITASVSGQMVGLDGTPTPGNLVGVQFGSVGVSAAYAYAVQAGDTLGSVAAGLANKIPGAISGSPNVNGWDGSFGGWDVGSWEYVDAACLWVPSGIGLRAATAAPATTITEVRRQEAGFRIACWCPSPSARDAIASAVDLGIAGLLDPNGWEVRFFQITQYEQGCIKSRSTYTNDYPARDRVWRRDLCFTVEYPTSLIQQNPTMMFGGIGLAADGGGVLQEAAPPQPASSVFTDSAVEE